MDRRRIYRMFRYKEAVFRICCDRFEAVTAEIIRQRHLLEAYIQKHPQFQSSFEPIELLDDAPPTAHHMAQAAAQIGVGPMAAVAGVMAQVAARAGLKAGAREAIVENGGDIYLETARPVIIGLYAGRSEKINNLAFELEPADTPLSICSSSGRMGHSMSLGQCDLATVVARDAALADAAATQAANRVNQVDDIEQTLNTIAAIKGIEGVLIIKNGHVGLAGQLPKLIKCPGF